MDRPNFVGVLLLLVLIGVLILFGFIAYKQYDFAWQIYQDTKNAQDAGARFSDIMENFDKTLTTLVGFITALATGILGYFGGASGKKEAQEEASQAKGALNEVTEKLDPAQSATFMDNIRRTYPKAFGH